MADFAVMETPDGNWRVEVYRPRGAPTFWYRLVNVPGENVIEGLTIGSVQRLLAEAGVDLADLIEAA